MAIPVLKPTNFTLTVDLPTTSFADAVTKVTEALASEGFGILTEIDIKTTMKEKLDVDERDYIILGACNPKLALSALSSLPAIGLLLPCNVVVASDDKAGSTVGIIDPVAMFSMVDVEGFTSFAKEVREMLNRVLQGLT
jgi:uncharacterized protein (DUF302 family)|tara:strand:+ start:508 stop:924 length:417 start_codon:yes stop_codon:yes gene_type:complete